MDERKRKLLMVLVVVLLVGIAAIQSVVDPVQAKIRKHEAGVSGNKNGELMVQLPGQFLVASVTGFKEVVAGMLWVRADNFFHSGQYSAIIPIVRLVTWLDPHNIDVFTTGAWHLDYNFVDEQEMSDKRYIPASIALLKEGIANNPQVYDLYFELGWTHYNRKLTDYRKAVSYIEKACTLDDYDPNTGQKTPRPEFVDRMLAHQYEKLGRIDDSIKQWGKAKARAKMLMHKNTGMYIDETTLDLCDRNLALLLLRKAWRYGDMDAYKKGVDLALKLAKSESGNSSWKEAAESASRDYQQRLAANNPPKDALKPLDAGFDVSFKRKAPKIFILKGKMNLAHFSEYQGLASECFTRWYKNNNAANAARREIWRDGCRVNWMLTDYDYKMPELDKFSLKIDTNKTVVWDSLYVAGGTFRREIDLSQNQEFYPFKADKYKLTVWFTPEQPNCPDYVQDRIGWDGKALTDKNYLDTKMLPGFKCLKKEFILNKKDLI